MLDQEQEQRSKLADAEEGMAQDAAADTAMRGIEESELESIHGRDEARTQLAAGELAWRLHWAKGLLEANVDHADATAALADATTMLATIRRRGDVEKRTWEALRDRRDLADARDRAKQVADDARAAAEGKQSEIADVRAEIKSRRTQIADLRDALQGWDGTSTPAEAQAVVDGAATAKAAADAGLLLAERDHADADATLRSARSGASPATAPALEALRSAGVQTVGLLDVITLDEQARPFWEAALTPWSHAVVAQDDDADAAVRAAAHLPGTTIVTAGGTESLPSGVTSSEPIGRFLAALASRHSPTQNPDGVIDVALGIITISGAPNPTTGRAGRVQAAELALMEAKVKLAAAHDAVERAAGRVELAEARSKGAAAEQERTAHSARIDARNLDLATLTQEKVALDEVEDIRVTEYDSARALATNHGAMVSAAESTWRRTLEDIGKVEPTVRAAQQRVENARLPYWTAGWGGALDEAREFIDAQPERPLAVVRYRGRASEALLAAVAAYVGKLVDVPADITAINSARGQLLDDDGAAGSRPPSFRDMARPLRDRLDGAADRDAINGERIQADRLRRQVTLDAQRREVEDGRSSLDAFQSMVEGLVNTHFERMKVAFNELDITAKGFGATLDVVTRRPVTATRPWQFEVVPRWRRSPGRAFVSYKKVSNGAQIKVHAILIALAALRANPGDGGGQVVIIDELGNSLGDMNRNDVLEALRSVSESQHITILGTCQDSVLKDAVIASKQLLWFTHASATDVLNRPVQMWDFDKDSAHARLAAPYMQAGRPLA
ncbi:DUF4200 domain-containing protein [Cellulomonas sp. WB94]|uniref:DUF4200 domain-containing protein n=1 Tax=Cellulomonas sp. WB94 TaxID=2173174 RepID=UPI0011B1D709|nr:DUF4200 domain-containing protein [Cellulomonas sp. WB94]